MSLDANIGHSLGRRGTNLKRKALVISSSSFGSDDEGERQKITKPSASSFSGERNETAAIVRDPSMMAAEVPINIPPFLISSLRSAVAIGKTSAVWAEKVLQSISVCASSVNQEYNMLRDRLAVLRTQAAFEDSRRKKLVQEFRISVAAHCLLQKSLKCTRTT